MVQGHMVEGLFQPRNLIVVPLMLAVPIVVVAAQFQLFAIKKEVKRIADHLTRPPQQ